MHRELVRGVRWLGTSPLLVTFSSEKAGDGFRNSLRLTSVRGRDSVPFREVRATPAQPPSLLLPV